MVESQCPGTVRYREGGGRAATTWIKPTLRRSKLALAMLDPLIIFPPLRLCGNQGRCRRLAGARPQRKVQLQQPHHPRLRSRHVHDTTLYLIKKYTIAEMFTTVRVLD